MGRKKVSRVAQVLQVPQAEENEARGTRGTLTTFSRGFTVIKHSKVSSNGFTVIELLIVVSIVVMLGTLVLTNFVDQPKKGRDGKRKADLLQIRGALESYNDDKGCYPSNDSVPCSGAGLSPYLSKIPCDPKTNESYLYDPDSSSLTCPTFYWLYAKLEYSKDPGIDTVGCAPGCGPGNAYNFKVGSPNAR